ncbi:MAG: chemotaxis protein CheW [Ghiorsea sp.]
MDEELLAEFLTESNENLDSIEQQLMDLEENPDDMELLDSIFRTIHTVKGSCGFLNLVYLEKIAHAGENLLSRIRSLKFIINEDIVSLLLECADGIKQLLEGLETTGQEPALDHSSIINRLQACERLVIAMAGGGSAASEVIEAAPAKPAVVAKVKEAVEVREEEGAEQQDTPSITWLPDFEEDVLGALAAQGLGTAEEVIAAGFANLRNIKPLTPADALKILGIARTHIEKPKQDDGEVSKATTKPKKAPKRKVAAKPAAEEVEITRDTEVKTAEIATLPAVQAKKKPAKVAAAPEAAKKAAKKRPASNASIRVDIGLLDELMNQVGELVLTRNSLMQMVNASGSMDFMRVGRDVDQITEQLQEQLLRTRMQPIQTIWSNVPRIVRDIGKQLDKKIKVVMEGEDTELDRTILSALKDPLTHIIRNSCDHGIESPATRRENGKPEEGVLRLTAVQESGFILISINDDGGGIDAQRIKDKALSMGVLTAEQAETISDKAALQLIFHAGLSTAEKVTNFSGRGVGMDVVRTEIERVGGSVDIDSTVGKGTLLRIRIPLTLAIISAMIVECKEQRFAIPQMSVQELLSAPESSEEWRLIGGQPFYRLRGKLLPILQLKQALYDDKEEKLAGSIVVADIGDRTFGILVDQIFGAEEIVVKPLGVHFQHLNFYGGCSILGDGGVIPIFDCNGLASMIQLSTEAEAAQYLADEDSSSSVKEQQHTLIFAQAKQRYAIPMALVERLECLEPERIESSASGEVLQYRGEVITVLRWADMLGQAASHEFIEDDLYCLILSDGGKRMCLQVDEVIDILEIPLEIKKTSESALFLGTAVIQDIATEVVDVFEVVQQADPHWFTQQTKARKAKILFVEDAQFFRHLVIPVLESLHFDIRTANDGQKACEILESYTPDLILTDIQMPNMDGFELAEWVKEQPNLHMLPVVALTGTKEFDKERAEGVFTDVLVKLDRQSLVADLDRILKTYSTTPVGQAGAQPPALTYE